MILKWPLVEYTSIQWFWELCFMESFHECTRGSPHGAWKPWKSTTWALIVFAFYFGATQWGSVMGGLWSQTTPIWTPALLPTSCVMLGRSFNLSFVIWEKLNSISTLYLSYGVAVGLNELKIWHIINTIEESAIMILHGALCRISCGGRFPLLKKKKKGKNKQTKPQTLTTLTQNMNNLLEFCHQE